MEDCIECPHRGLPLYCTVVDHRWTYHDLFYDTVLFTKPTLRYHEGRLHPLRSREATSRWEAT